MRTVTIKCEDGVDVSDGYHTFGELYDHRCALWIALCRAEHNLQQMARQTGAIVGSEDAPWRSRLHSDGSTFDGWFVLGQGRARGQQVTYHLPIAIWDATDFADTLERAPEFDGHTSADVLARIRAWK